MIGREREIKELNKLYESDSAELIAIYGRLGVGKTYLVEEVFFRPHYVQTYRAISRIH